MIGLVWEKGIRFCQQAIFTAPASALARLAADAHISALQTREIIAELSAYYPVCTAGSVRWELWTRAPDGSTLLEGGIGRQVGDAARPSLFPSTGRRKSPSGQRTLYSNASHPIMLPYQSCERQVLLRSLNVTSHVVGQEIASESVRLMV